jgi:hypothetical protein
MGTARVVAVCLVLGAAAPALAGPRTSKVTIETEPSGAKVYFGLKEDGEVCTTPCTVEAPVGETPIIVEAEGRRSVIENMIVPRRSPRPLRFRYKLEPAIGALVVIGGDGGTIKIDEQDAGKAPGRVDGLAAGPHHVVVERGGKPVFDDYLEVDAGREATATVADAAPRERERDPAPTPSEPDEVIDAVDEPAAAARPAAAFALGVVSDVGFRQFSYANNRTLATQRDDKESGQWMAGPVVEVWPTRLAGLTTLRGLSLYGRLELGLNTLGVTVVDARTGMTLPTTLSTTWRSFELSARQRWVVGSATIELGAGFVQDRFQFKGSNAEIALVPDANYKAIRIGARAALRLGALEPYVSVEDRPVLSGGALAERYTLGTSANGVRATAGAGYHAGSVEVRAEGSLTRYGWTFKPSVSDATQADGGTDLIELVQLVVCYTR